MEFIKRILSWIFKPSQPKIFLGVLGDGSETDNVVEFEEAVGPAQAAATVLDLKESDPSAWRKFLYQFQSSSSGCVAFTIGKIAQILFFIRTGRKIKFSPGWVYKQRSNFPDLGMWIDDVIRIAGSGMITEDLYPSENLTESQINFLPEEPYGQGVAEEFAIPMNWVNLPINFDTIAKSIKKTEKGIMMWFDFGPGEWFGQGIPKITGSYTPWRHSVTGVDAVKYNGIDYIVIEDSADREEDVIFGHRKLISRDFLAKRCLLARYPLSFKFEPQGPQKPSYDGSVASLQDCLTFEGVFPSNVTARGYYGAITIKAVQDFQVKHGIVYSGSPDTTGFGRVGPKTSAKLQELFP